jgi:disulfide bond formation protein DsbB
VTSFQRARWLALLVPGALMLGALGSQYIGGLYPCEMCHWQRWPHDAAIVLAMFAFGLRSHPAKGAMVALAGLGIFISGAIGVFHAGVEYGWWEGLTTCAKTAGSGGGSVLADIMAAPVIRCDQPQWTLAGISLAGFNALISIPAALVIWGLLRHKDA